jgi:hypothetical protein
MKHLLLICFIITLGATTALSQTTYSDRAYRQYPHWIIMMDDTLSNFNEVNKAFDLYWEQHEMPHEEDAILGMKDATEEEKENKEGWLKKLFKGKRQPDETELAYALKRYRYWKLKSEPWVQEDGRILTPFERQQILETIRR